MSRAAVVYNPIKVTDLPALTTRVEKFMAENGWEQPLWLETTEEDPGVGMCRQAVDEGCDVVFVCGGDGTVMAAATALAGQPVPLAILPAGTGNLLARNLDLPINDEAQCLRIGVSGRTRAIDVGGGRGPQVRGDGRPRLRRRDHAGRPGGAEEEGRLAGVRRVGDQAPARPRHPGDDHDRRRHAAAPAGAHRGRRQRRQAAGQHPAAARRAAGRRGARRGRDRDPQRPRLGPGRGSGGASGATCRTAGWSASPASTC